jgi:hypothetical protein
MGLKAETEPEEGDCGGNNQNMDDGYSGDGMGAPEGEKDKHTFGDKPFSISHTLLRLCTRCAIGRGVA